MDYIQNNILNKESPVLTINMVLNIQYLQGNIFLKVYIPRKMFSHTPGVRLPQVEVATTLHVFNTFLIVFHVSLLCAKQIPLCSFLQYSFTSSHE
jgi:hypothetical protein